MQLNTKTGEFNIENKIFLSPVMCKSTFFEKNDTNWENWFQLNNNETLGYRTIYRLKNNQYGPLYLIVTFVDCSDTALLSNWYFAPEMLGDGEQHRPTGGKVTKRLKAWFKDVSSIMLPVRGKWGHIDAEYDVRNSSASIICNYRNAFKSDEEWRQYCKWNKIRCK